MVASKINWTLFPPASELMDHDRPVVVGAESSLLSPPLMLAGS
jgi:hypothetical protein